MTFVTWLDLGDLPRKSGCVHKIKDNAYFEINATYKKRKQSEDYERGNRGERVSELIVSTMNHLHDHVRGSSGSCLDNCPILQGLFFKSLPRR